MRIAHLSDIHIRKTRRHQEYKVVLNNLVSRSADSVGFASQFGAKGQLLRPYIDIDTVYDWWFYWARALTHSSHSHRCICQFIDHGHAVGNLTEYSVVFR